MDCGDGAGGVAGDGRRDPPDEQTFAVALANLVAMSLTGFEGSGTADRRRNGPGLVS